MVGAVPADGAVLDAIRIPNVAHCTFVAVCTSVGQGATGTVRSLRPLIAALANARADDARHRQCMTCAVLIHCAGADTRWVVLVSRNAAPAVVRRIDPERTFAAVRAFPLIATGTAAASERGAADRARVVGAVGFNGAGEGAIWKSAVAVNTLIATRCRVHTAWTGCARRTIPFCRTETLTARHNGAAYGNRMVAAVCESAAQRAVWISFVPVGTRGAVQRRIVSDRAYTAIARRPVLGAGTTAARCIRSRHGLCMPAAVPLIRAERRAERIIEVAWKTRPTGIRLVRPHWAHITPSPTPGITAQAPTPRFHGAGNASRVGGITHGRNVAPVIEAVGVHPRVAVRVVAIRAVEGLIVLRGARLALVSGPIVNARLTLTFSVAERGVRIDGTVVTVICVGASLGKGRAATQNHSSENDEEDLRTQHLSMFFFCRSEKKQKYQLFL